MRRPRAAADWPPCRDCHPARGMGEGVHAATHPGASWDVCGAEAVPLALAARVREDSAAPRRRWVHTPRGTPLHPRARGGFCTPTTRRRRYCSASSRAWGLQDRVSRRREHGTLIPARGRPCAPRSPTAPSAYPPRARWRLSLLRLVCSPVHVEPTPAAVVPCGAPARSPFCEGMPAVTRTEITQEMQKLTEDIRTLSYASTKAAAEKILHLQLRRRELRAQLEAAEP